MHNMRDYFAKAIVTTNGHVERIKWLYLAVGVAIGVCLR